MIDRRSRTEIQRVCTHIISRERHARTGRIGLWWTGDGIGTDTIHLDDVGLHRQGTDEVQPLTTLHELAAWAGVDLSADYFAGKDALGAGDPDAKLQIDRDALTELVALYRWAWQVLEPTAGGAPITLWPEHFDAAYIWQDKANIGVSPGDDQIATPYLYLGPWTDDRPGTSDFWNAPFGATLPAPATKEAATTFIAEGQARLGMPT